MKRAVFAFLALLFVPVEQAVFRMVRAELPDGYAAWPRALVAVVAAGRCGVRRGFGRRFVARRVFSFSRRRRLQNLVNGCLQ